MEDEKFYTVRGYQLHEQEKGVLTASLEDYLEMIYRSIMSSGFVRGNELAKELNVKPSSVSKMIAKLSSLGYIDYEKYGVIKLTEKGIETGKYLLWRHKSIESFFKLVSCDKEIALMETELVEHILSKNTVRNISDLVEFINKNDNIRREYIKYKNCKHD